MHTHLHQLHSHFDSSFRRQEEENEDHVILKRIVMDALKPMKEQLRLVSEDIKGLREASRPYPEGTPKAKRAVYMPSKIVVEEEHHRGGVEQISALLQDPTDAKNVVRGARTLVIENAFADVKIAGDILLRSIEYQYPEIAKLALTSALLRSSCAPWTSAVTKITRSISNTRRHLASVVLRLSQALSDIKMSWRGSAFILGHVLSTYSVRDPITKPATYQQALSQTGFNRAPYVDYFVSLPLRTRNFYAALWLDSELRAPRDTALEKLTDQQLEAWEIEAESVRENAKILRKGDVADLNDDEDVDLAISPTPLAAPATPRVLKKTGTAATPTTPKRSSGPKKNAVEEEYDSDEDQEGHFGTMDMSEDEADTESLIPLRAHVVVKKAAPPIASKKSSGTKKVAAPAPAEEEVDDDADEEEGNTELTLPLRSSRPARAALAAVKRVAPPIASKKSSGTKKAAAPADEEVDDEGTDEEEGNTELTLRLRSTRTPPTVPAATNKTAAPAAPKKAPISPKKVPAKVVTGSAKRSASRA